MPANAASKHDVVPMRTILTHMVLPVLMSVIMGLCYLGGLHKPDPHGIPVAVIGSNATTATTASAIQQAVGDRLEVRTVATAAQAMDELRRQEIAGAYFPTNTPGLLTASAASDPQNTVVTKIFTAVAAKAGHPLIVQDVVPLAPNDPIGQNAFFFLVVLSIGSYATAITIAAAGATRRFRERLALALGAGIAVPTILLAIASMFFDMFTGHGAAVWALSVVYSLIVLGVTVGLHTLVGRYSTVVFNAMFVALNFTSSGGIFPTNMQPGFFGWLNNFWIGSAFISLMNHVMYFPDADMTHGMWIMVGWAVFALASLLVAYSVEVRRRRRARLVHHAKSMRAALENARTDGLTPRQAMELELAEDVIV